MFGYIAPAFSALSDEQKKRYRTFYCGLCEAIRARHGQTARISLSNDMTFLAVLLTSLYEPETSSTHTRCAVHPVRNHDYLISGMIDYAADMNTLLFYYKCLDQRMDDRSAAGRTGEKAFRKRLVSVRSRYPRQAEDVRLSLEALWQEELKSAPDPDRLCNLSGRMLGTVFTPLPDDLWAPHLYALGEGLGRFIYWMDAWEDYDADRKKGRFNPLLPYHSRPDYEDFCRETLELLIAEATEHFEILPLEADLDLLRNVLYAGVWQRYHQINERRRKAEHRDGKEDENAGQ